MNIPWTTVCVFVAALFSIVALVVTGHSTNATVTVLVGMLPGLVAAGYAERSSRDIRNGVVQEKVKAGTHEALQESGVAQVAAQANESTTLAMNALAELLRRNTIVTETNTQAQTPSKDNSNGPTV